jgi:2-polyprenyl-3-methyl-5-hydroxy-6-metoxy-1,4-benzoquinol methylase
MAECRICATPTVFYVSKSGFDIDRCPACGFGQVDVSQDVLDSFYDKAYFNGEKAGFEQQENEMISVSKHCWIEKELAKLSGRGPLHVLEIGPGLGGPIAGYFERERKTDVYAAIEFSDYAAQRLRQRGLDVWVGRVVDPEILDACRGNYDFVFGTEVIEHDLDPKGFLRAVHDMLKPGGRAAFTTGNLDGRMAKRNKADWYYLDPPAHVSFWTPRSARRGMTDVGFKDFGVTRYGFRHIEAAQKLPSFLRDAVLWATDLSNISTGMTISAQRS